MNCDAAVTYHNGRIYAKSWLRGVAAVAEIVTEGIIETDRVYDKVAIRSHQVSFRSIRSVG